MTKNKKTEVRSLLTNFFLLLSGFILSLFLIEGILRVIPQSIVKIDFSSKDDIRIFSATREYEYKPNSERDFTSLGSPVVWHFNNYGFRDKSFSKDKPMGKVYRIAFLGDSMVMGLGVEDYESLPRQLERVLLPKTYSNGDQLFEVYNMGIWGSTAAQTYLAILKERAIELKPDLVILGWFSSDSGESGANELDKKYNTLKSLPDTLVPYNLGEFLKKHSYFYNLFLDRYYHLISGAKAELPKNSILIEEGWKIADRDLGKMKELTDKNKIKFLLVGIPNIAEVIDPNIELYSDRQEKLTGISQKYDIQYVDLKPYLLDHRNFRNYYIDGVDNHFNAQGNRLVAEFLADYLIKNGLLPSN